MTVLGAMSSSKKCRVRGLEKEMKGSEGLTKRAKFVHTNFEPAIN